MSHLHRYPDPSALRLCEALAEEHGVDARHILVGNGSDELIYLLTWAFAANGGTVLCADPPYRLNELSATVAGASVIRVPLVDWTHDLPTMARAKADLAYVVNPHNPSGTVCASADIAKFVEECESSVPVIDEAYIDYADDPDVSTAIPLALAGKAMVLRTFSKIYGLAGVRLGYLVGDPNVLDILRNIRPPFSVGTLAQHAGIAALRDKDHYRESRAHVVTNRARLHRLLADAGYHPIRSQANFILVTGVNEVQFVRKMAEHGIAIRPGSSLGVQGAVRISVPGDSGLTRLAAALGDIDRVDVG